MRVLFVKNKYYFDEGMEYIFSRLKEELFLLGIKLEIQDIYPNYGFEAMDISYKFAVIWDKDVSLVRYLERNKIRCINSAAAIEACDDKEKTYSMVEELDIKLPKTIISPLMYDSSDAYDKVLLDKIRRLDFPLIVKENTGSAGRQVYLAENQDELMSLYNKLKYKPHMFQQFIKGKIGQDIRIYTIGANAVAAVERYNTFSFKSNVSQGGKLRVIPLSDKLKYQAELIAKKLGLDYGSIDFMQQDNDYYFIEANSNAYFRGIENAGQNIAKPLSEYIKRVTENA